MVSVNQSIRFFFGAAWVCAFSFVFLKEKELSIDAVRDCLSAENMLTASEWGMRRLRSSQALAMCSQRVLLLRGADEIFDDDEKGEAAPECRNYKNQIHVNHINLSFLQDRVRTCHGKEFYRRFPLFVQEDTRIYMQLSCQLCPSMLYFLEK